MDTENSLWLSSQVKKTEMQVNTRRLFLVIAPSPTLSPISGEPFCVILTHNERAETHLFDDVFNDPHSALLRFLTTSMTGNPNETRAVALGTAKPIALAHEII